tara:strand:+ start:259 stop:978 length:720 start_codon:yes stop_codon:yes gene_type:complete
MSAFLDKLKTDQDTQIMTVCVAFFLIAFPAYFAVASSIKDVGVLGGEVGTYEAMVNETVVEVGSIELSIGDGDSADASFNTDAVKDQLSGKHVAIARLVFTWQETNEDTQIGAGAECDEVSADYDLSGATHNESSDTGSESWTENGNCANEVSHTIEFKMIDNYSSNNTTYEDMTEEEVMSKYGNMDLGRGSFMTTVSVTADKGSSPVFGENDDPGEDVTVTLELVVILVTIEKSESDT